MNKESLIFYHAPYKLLFEKEGVVSLEVLISKIIIFVQSDIDKNAVNDLKIFIAQNVNSANGVQKFRVISELLSLCDDSVVCKL